MSVPLCVQGRDGEVTKRQSGRKRRLKRKREVEIDGKMSGKGNSFLQKVTDGVGSDQMAFELSTSAPPVYVKEAGRIIIDWLNCRRAKKKN